MANSKKLALLDSLKFLSTPSNFTFLSVVVVLILSLFVIVLNSSSNFSASGWVGSEYQPRIETGSVQKTSLFSLPQFFSPKKAFAATVEKLGCRSNGDQRIRVSWSPKPGYTDEYLYSSALYGFPITGAGGQSTRNTYVEGWYGGNKHWSFVVFTSRWGAINFATWDYGDFWTDNCPVSTPTPRPSPPSSSPTPPLPSPQPSPIPPLPSPQPSPTPPLPSPQPSPTPPPVQVDLAAVSFNLSKSTLLPGETFQARFVVGNLSNAPISSNVAFYLHSSSRPTCGQTSGKVVEDNYSLRPGENFNADPVLTAPTVPGNYTAWVFVDWTCNVNETSEQNNVLSVSYVVASQSQDCKVNINGLKFYDVNSNGRQDSNEQTGLPGFTFLLINNDNSRISTVTDSTGRFSFGLQPCGTYTIVEMPRTSWQSTTPTSIKRDFNDVSTEPVLFGNTLIPSDMTACDDMDGNRIINWFDALLVAKHMPPAAYDARYDVNKDQQVDITDVYLVASEVGRSCQTQTTVSDPTLSGPTFQCDSGFIKATLSWYPPTSVSVDTYTVQISTTTNFNNPDTTRTYQLPGSVTSHTVYPLSPQSTYYWRVIANAGGSSSPGRSVNQFITPNCQFSITPPVPPLPPGPILPSPPPLNLPEITPPPLPNMPQQPSGGLPSIQYPTYPYPQYPSTGNLPQIPGLPPLPTPPSTQFGVPPGIQSSDLFPPTVRILTPKEKAKVSGEVEIQVTAADNVGVTKVEIYVNDQLRTTLTKSPYSWIWNVDQEPEITNTKVPLYCRFLFGLCRTSFVISAKAYDAAGHISADSVLVYRSR